jgi:hypothetical protein
MNNTDLPRDADDAVRRALADARHNDPMPADVSARLDRVLDGLNAERADAAPVVSLEARRRRRYAARTLVAAAAVVVGGFGIDAMVGHHVTGGSSENASTSSRVDRSENASGASAPAAPSVPGSVPGPQVTGGGDYSSQSGKELDKRAMALTGATAPRDVLQLYNRALLSDAIASTGCRLPARGNAVLVTYDGRRAALLIHQPVGDQQTIVIYSCPRGHTGHILRTVVLTAH